MTDLKSIDIRVEEQGDGLMILRSLPPWYKQLREMFIFETYTMLVYKIKTIGKKKIINILIVKLLKTARKKVSQ